MKISGRVLDVETGKGISDAPVRLFDHETELAQVTTDENGEYCLEVDVQEKPELQLRPAQVKAGGKGYEPKFKDLDLKDSGPHEFQFELSSAPEVLEVLVNQADGTPLSDVRLHLFGGKKVLWDESTTDEQGLARFDIAPEKLDQQPLLKVHKDGFYGVERLAFLKRNMPQMQVTLEPSNTEQVPLGGKVLNDLGEPVSGAQVTFELPGAAPQTFTTGADGTWKTILDKDLYGGEGLLSASHPDYHTLSGIVLPLAPNAFHVMPLQPLVERKPEGPPKAAAVVVILIILAGLAWLFT